MNEPKLPRNVLDPKDDIISVVIGGISKFIMGTYVRELEVKTWGNR